MNESGTAPSTRLDRLNSRLSAATQPWRRHAASRNPFVRAGAKAIQAIAWSATAAARVCLSPEYRSIVFLRFFNAPNLHQTTVLTRMNRYPGIFSACRRYFDGRTDLRILSYGCATGEEVLTLRRYFPSSVIVGAEINRSSLARCRSLAVDDRMAFVYSDHQLIAQHGPFDAIFCMAVLQRGPHNIKEMAIDSLKGIYPFEKFDRAVSDLDSLLKEDGLLVIHHSQYDVRDASVAAAYDPLDDGPDDGFPRFDRNSLRKSQPSSTASIFVKRRSS